jgi:hypothetical protein
MAELRPRDLAPQDLAAMQAQAQREAGTKRKDAPSESPTTQGKENARSVARRLFV